MENLAVWSWPITVRDDRFFGYPPRTRANWVEDGHFEDTDPANDTTLD